MSKKYDQYVEDFRNRSAKIPWNFYLKILRIEFGAKEAKRSHAGGSKRAYSIGDSVFVLHKPHGKNDPVGKWDHHNVLDLLEKEGLVKDEKEQN